jgi:hypothetical protein
MSFLKDKNILIISPESWGKSLLSKHHYALELAMQGNRVWFLNSPYYKRNEECDKVEARYPNLKIVDDTIFKGLSKLPSWVQKNIIRKQAQRLVKKMGVSPDVVWSFDNSRYFFLDVFQKAYRIQHLVDAHGMFHLETACKTAQLCLGVTPYLVSCLAKHNANAHFIQHGYKHVIGNNAELKKMSGNMNAAYVGNLFLHAFDAQLMLQLARMHTDVNFHLIGSYSKDHLNNELDAVRTQQLFELGKLPNVALYGEKDYDEAFTLTGQCNMLLLMYFDKSYEIGNSSKILPYLSTGKVVLSDYLELYNGHDLLEMAHTREEYLNLFQTVKLNLEHYHTDEWCAIRRQYALDNSYKNQLGAIDALMAKSIV